MAAGKNTHVLSLDHLIRFANGERSVGCGEYWPAWAAESQVGGPHVVAQGKRSGLSLVVITGDNHGHTRKHFHHADVFEDLMRGSIFTQSHARMGGTYLY